MNTIHTWINTLLLGAFMVVWALVGDSQPVTVPATFGGSSDSGYNATASGVYAVDGTTVINGSGLATPLGLLMPRVSVTADTVLTSADCGKSVILNDATGTTTVTLPAVTNAGCAIAVAVGTVFDTGNIIIDSAEGDNIDGTLSVNVADVACAGEDQINVVHTAESLGDNVSLVSNNTGWLIVGSLADTAGALTCTDPS